MMPQSFDAFLKEREAASLDYINGRSAPLAAIAAQADPATFMSPMGSVVQGAAAVSAAHKEGAWPFREGSSGHFEVLQSGASGDLGFWTGLQHAEAMLKGKDEPESMVLRTTEIFRLEDGAWKLVHRHADFKDKR
jgi:ketosteroid isomerase-like protein